MEKEIKELMNIKIHDKEIEIQTLKAQLKIKKQELKMLKKTAEIMEEK